MWWEWARDLFFCERGGPNLYSPLLSWPFFHIHTFPGRKRVIYTSREPQRFSIGCYPIIIICSSGDHEGGALAGVVLLVHCFLPFKASQTLPGCIFIGLYTILGRVSFSGRFVAKRTFILSQRWQVLHLSLPNEFFLAHNVPSCSLFLTLITHFFLLKSPGDMLLYLGASFRKGTPRQATDEKAWRDWLKDGVIVGRLQKPKIRRVEGSSCYRWWC